MAIETKKSIYPPIFPALADTRYRSLDMWRGVACLMIVVLHASLWAKFDDNAIQRAAHPLASIAIDIFHRFGAGVPIFFVISGYCIAATADSTRRRSKRITLDYFKRRLRRILPPYWAMVAIAIALSVVVEMAGHADLLSLSPTVGAIPRPGSLTATQWLGNLTLTETWRAHLFGPAGNKFLGPSWTLCYEEQFYVVCGLLLLVSPRRFFTGAMIITAATAVIVVGTAIHPTEKIDGFFFDGPWLIFAFGVFVYYHLNYRTGKRSVAIPIGLLATLFALAFIRYGLLRHSDDAVAKDQIFGILNGVVFALLILALRPMDEAISGAKILRRSPGAGGCAIAFI